MWRKFNTKLCIFALSVIVTTRNLIRAQTLAPKASEHVIEIQSVRQFQDLVLASKDNILVQYHAPWCIPCKSLSPILIKKVNEQNGKIKLARMDLATQELQDFANAQGIRQIPIIITYKNGKIVDKLQGFKEHKSVLQYVEKQLDRM